MKHGLLFLLLILAQNAFALYGSKIQEANEDFVVSLHLKDSRHPSQGFFCSGVLISSTRVLTAGHCIDGLGLELYEMSQALVYYPQRVQVEVGGKMIRAKSITYSDTYFESSGHEAADLAVIDLVSPVTNVKPLAIAHRTLLKPGKKVSLIARKSKVETTLIQLKNFSGNFVLFLDQAAGACMGDSGGAVVINEKGQQLLAGILMYSGGRTCYRKNGYANYPTSRF